MRTRWYFWLALLAAMAALTWIGVVVANRRAPGTGVAVAFLGYTNDITGSRFGLFAVTNLDRLPVQRLNPAVELEGLSGLRAPVFNPNLPWLPRAPLPVGGSHTIAVGVPLDPGRWRLCLRFQRRTMAERLRDYLIAHRHPVPVTLGPVILLGPPQYGSTNSAWVTN